MNKILYCVLFAHCVSVGATTFEFTPGRAPVAISPSGNGILVTDMNGGGNTQVIRNGNIQIINGPEGPAKFIYEGAEPVQPAIPVANDLVLPIE